MLHYVFSSFVTSSTSGRASVCKSDCPVATNPTIVSLFVMEIKDELLEWSDMELWPFVSSMCACSELLH
jgi:hypothetical protein